MTAPIDTTFVSGTTITSDWLNGVNDEVNSHITANTTLLVPSQYATINLALAYLATKIINSGVTVTIQVANGTHAYTSSISLNHPQGSQIRLIGNESTPASCILDFGTSTVDALIATNGSVLGYLNGFTVRKNAKAVVGKWNSADTVDDIDNSTGILAHNGSTIICGTSIVVQNFYYGIAARNGSYVDCPKAVVSGGGDVNIWAFVGSTIDCAGATSSNAKDVSVTSTGTNAYGYGIQAEYGSTVNCSKYNNTDVTTTTGNNIAGIAALSNSTIRAHYAVASTNVGSGFLARDYGSIENHNATANNNTRYGEEYLTSGFIIGSPKTLTGNTLGLYNGVVYLDNGSLGARIAANGDLRIDNNSTGATYFNTSGGPQLKVAHTASSANYPLLTGSASTTVSFAPEGGSNLDVALKGKGTGYTYLGGNYANYLRVNGAAGGSHPQLRAEGVTDPDIDLILGGKGTGTVRFGTWASNADAPVNGYITIKDFAGNVRKIPTIA